MDAATLREAMGRTLSLERYTQLLPAFNRFLLEAGCITVNRAAMACAQLGHESLGLKYGKEIWGPTKAQRGYEGRKDLGNTQPGDGARFAGAGWLQVTGRFNFTAVSKWAHSKGYVPTPSYFVDHPSELASDAYVWVGPVWYWTVARPQLNSYADAGDIVAATKAINGGTNGLDDREVRWNACRRLGAALLPTPVAEEDDMPSVPEVATGVWGTPIDDAYTPQGGDRMPAFAALAWAVAHAAHARDAAGAALASAQRCEQKLDQVLAALNRP